MKNLKFLSLCLLIAGALTLSGCIGESIDKTTKKAQEALNKKEPIIEPSIPADCISWFDGCNNCFVIDGEIGGCTRKFCSEEVSEKPRCLKTRLIIEGIEEEEMVLTIGPEKVDCIGVGPQKCLVVNGEMFYESIEGFNYKSGFEYEVRVKKSLTFGTRDTTKIPADASMYKYELIDILSKTEK